MNALTAFGIFVFAVATTACWIYAFVEVVRIPAWQFYAAGSNKALWVCTVFFLGIIGASLWLFLKRTQVLDAADATPPIAPPDFYPVRGTGALRWWDGYTWSDRYDTWSGGEPGE